MGEGLRLVVLSGLLLAVGLSPPVRALRAQGSDWDRPNHNVRSIMRDYYGGPLTAAGMSPDACLADQGERCFGGDVEDQNCTQIPACRSPESQAYFLRRLRAAAEGHRDNAFAMGQAVYAFTRLGHLIEAYRLAQECSAVHWWCGLLRGLVLHRSGQPIRAEAEFSVALQHADPALACGLRDIGLLLSGADHGVYAARACGSRDTLEARFWWLTDPVYSIEGNDRYAEHVARRLEAVLHRQIVEARYFHHPDAHEAQLVRWGSEDSWQGGSYRRFTSRRGARYHFAPQSGAAFGSIEGLSYRLEAGSSEEGFTPTYGPVVRLSGQFVRFRDGDSMLVVAATDLAGSPAADWNDPSAVLVLSDEPGRFSSVRPHALEGERILFGTALPALPHVASLELTSDEGVGRHREGIAALPIAGFVVSDVLMYEPSEAAPPESRAAAVTRMLGTTVIEAGSRLGVYWEAYGVAKGDSIDAAIEIEGARRGLLARIVGAIGLGPSRETPSVVSWVGTVGANGYRRAVDVDVSTLEPGTYVLRLVLETRAGAKAESVRDFRIVSHQ